MPKRGRSGSTDKTITPGKAYPTLTHALGGWGCLAGGAAWRVGLPGGWGCLAVGSSCEAFSRRAMRVTRYRFLP